VRDELHPESRPDASSGAFQAALAALARPVTVVWHEGHAAVVVGGRAELGVTPRGDALPLVGFVPPLLPGDLGDPAFRADHGVRLAYVAGEMANGIASEELVISVARAGMLGVFGAAGLPVAHVEQAMVRLEAALPGLPWGVNLIHSPDDPKLEAALVDLFLARGHRFVSASAYLDLTLPVVRYRVTGIHRDASGRVVVPNRLMAKVSRVEVAARFLHPPPERFLAELVATGVITAEQAELAATIPMADDVTAEADSGGHTDNRPLVLLLPALAALRDQIAHERGYDRRIRVGAAGGLATPASVASAFAMGAAYVVTGSINQATLEAGTSDRVRQLLAEAATTDVAMAPAADMFEMGVRVQVLTRGTLFAVRAARLYELYRAYDSLAALPPAVRDELETKLFRSTLEEAWEACRAFFAERDPVQLERAAREPRHQLALVFRAYLGQASRWANAGVADRALDYQIWCGPSMGAFNEWTRGSFLAAWENRRAVVLAKNLMVGAATLTRAAALRTQLGALPPAADQFAPRTEAALDALLQPRSLLDDAVMHGHATNGHAGVAAAADAPRVSPGARSADEPIAIVGMGAMFPDAPNLAAFWRLLRTGRDAVRDVPETHWSLADYHDADPHAPDKTYAKRGAFLPPHAFDPTEFGIPPSILEATDTSQLLGLVVARMAMDDAGYGEGRAWDRSRASVILGVTGTQELVISLGARLGHPRWRRALEAAGVDATTAADVVDRISRSYVGWQESSFPGLLGNVVAGRIANRLDLGGTNCVLDAACASSLAAVHLAVLELRAGASDLVVTGGVDCLNDIFMHMCFSKTPALSASGDVRPFSDKADGTLLGEGLGMVVLKRLSDAERDGDRVYARILGVGTSSDGRAKSVYAPLPAGQARALRAAYANAGVRPHDVTLVEAHGTGTKAGDLAEFEALRAVYREDSDAPPWCTLGTVKSQLGHTKAAAGAAGMMKAALALHHKVLPPTLKVERPHPSMQLAESPFTLSSVAAPWLASGTGPRLAGVSSFGFGGSNFHLVLSEQEAARADVAWDGSVEILAVSSVDAPSLIAAVEAFLRLPAEEAETALRRSRETFDPARSHRLVAVMPDGANVAALLRPALDRVAKGPTSGFQLPVSTDGAVQYGCGPALGDVAFLFPGQGAQHVGMLRELSCLFPELLAAVESAPDVAREIYPLATFDEAEAARREAHLTRTDVAQPALGLVCRGLARLLVDRFGVKPAMVAGHSYGELVALHAAGVLDAAGLLAASRARGSLMHGEGGDRGTMLAVLAPLAEVERLLADERLDLVLANRNGPRQGVLSGARAEIDRAAIASAARGLRTAPLAVGAAFHSPLVAAAASAFRASLERIPWREASLPVIADATAEAYPADPVAGRDLLAQQLARPVRFDEVVERLYAAGARTFVEVGPKAALTGMVRAILGDRPFTAMAVDASGKRGGLFDLAQLLGGLAVAGHSVQLGAWERRAVVASAPRKAKMSVPLTGANYRSPETSPAPPPRRAPAAPGAVAVVKAPVAPTVTAGVVAATSPRAPVFAPLDSGPLAEGIRALQAMQEQTARVHQLFLEGQRSAHQSLQALLGASPGALPLEASSATPAHAPPPAPVVHPVAMPPVVAAPVVPSSGGAASGEPVDIVPLLLAVVAQATGYPEETLSLEMGMEADLGIDSIKRVEILSMLSKRIPGAPSVNPEKLGALRTLQDVATFIGGARGAPTAGHERKTNGATAPQAAPARSTVDVRGVLLEVVSQLTGYPLETLSLEMDMEADLGIDSIKRVEILSMLTKRVPGAPSVNPEKLSKLRTLEQVLRFVDERGDPAPAPVPVASNGHGAEPVVAGPSAEAVRASLHRRAVVPVAAPPATGGASPLPDGPVLITADDSGLAEALARRFVALGRSARVLRTAADATGPVGTLVLLAPDGARWTEACEARLKAALGLARDLGPRLRESGVRVGGQALLVTVSRRDGAFGCAARAPRWNPLQGGLAGLAKTAAHEWPEVRCRAVDVASAWSIDVAAHAVVAELSNHGPREVGLGPAGRVTLALREEQALPLPHRFHRGGVVVVTGGARGVTADCARALALRTGVSLALLGRSAVPTEEPTWLRAATTEADVKRACLEHAPAGERPTPKALGEACRAILGAREIRASLQALEAVGVRAVYRSVDVRDAGGVAAALAHVRASLGPIEGVIHGAGVVRDRRIEDKRDEDFDEVLGPKLAGLRALLDATRGDDLRCLVLFASATGRFGRRGQSDYAVANQALVSIARSEAAERPGCRVVALDWGPWEGGMVTPALRKEFEREGVPLIPLAAGAAAMCDEALSLPGGPSEVVLGAGFGSEEPAAWSLASEWRLDASLLPVLRDHGLAGKAVLPLAVTLDWFAAAATSISGRPVVALDDVRVFRGVTVGAEPCDVSVWAGAPEAAVVDPAGEDHEARSRFQVELRSGPDNVHVRASVTVGPPLSSPVAARAPEGLRSFRTPIDRVYAEQLFHGPTLEAIEAIESMGEAGMVLRLRAHATSERLLGGVALPWAVDPLVLDGVFQAMIVWSRAHVGAPSLPSGVASLRLFAPIPETGVRAVVTVQAIEGMVVSSDVDLLDDAGRPVARLLGVLCTASPTLQRAFSPEAPAATTLPTA